MPAGDTISRASAFLWAHARLLERRGFEHAFAGGSAGAVVDALRAYRNRDGGFGHALEPDLRTPTSQPLFVDFALTTLHETSASDPQLVASACEFVSRVADERGALAYVLPDALQQPRADHWNGDYATRPSLHATSAIVGRLHALGARHAWLDRATEWCFAQIEGSPTYSGHSLRNTLTFLEHAPDRKRATALWDRVAARLFEKGHVLLELPVTTYGLTPLRFAPRPSSPTRSLFSDGVIEAHLDALLAEQQVDGGWPIRWDPPGSAAVSEWRGKWTLDALRTLRAYGRI